MNTTTSIDTVVVQHPHYDDQIAAIPDQVFLHPDVQSAAARVLQTSAEAVANSTEVWLEVEQEVAAGQMETVRKKVQEITSRIADLQAQLDDANASTIQVVMSGLVFLTMLVAETQLNFNVLPWLVGASGFSALALSAAASLTPLILEKVIAGCFGSEPWTMTGPHSRSRKFLLAAVGLLNLAVVATIGFCRGIVAVLKNSENALGLTFSQAGFVDTGLLLLSLALAVDAALFFLYFFHEVELAIGIEKWGKELKEAETVNARLESEYTEAQKKASMAAKRLGDQERFATALKEGYVAECQLRFQTRLALIEQTTDQKTTLEMMEKIQARGMRVS